MIGRIYVGCATWAIGAANESLLPPAASNLARYARALTAAEVNSSFHRAHRRETWGRWARSVGPSFRFSAKLPKAISHERRLVGCDELLEAFLAEVELLGEKLGPLLLQLPPSFAWDEPLVTAFLDRLDAHTVVVEPRHPSWFADEVDAYLAARRIARVAADPAVVPRAAEPGGWDGLRYFRLHGSPVTYRSSYEPTFLDGIAPRLRPGDWCIFDNTASGAALGNALGLLSRLRR
jgi:uncharacterized protein YecE (DUF72 family)